MNWLPSELTLNDMMNLYTSDGGDMWTIIEDVPGKAGECFILCVCMHTYIR